MKRKFGKCTRIQVDEQPLHKITKDLWWGPSGQTYCWYADLEPGKHVVVSNSTRTLSSCA